MDVDLNSLMVFRDLAESGNFSETGRRMGLSQPAVSLTITNLEQAVGLVLLERKARGTVLTPEGDVFLTRTKEVCDAYSAFKDELKHQARRLDKKVSLGLDGSFYSLELAKLVEQEHVTEDKSIAMGRAGENWTDDLESGRTDLVIATRFLQEGMTAGIQEAVIRKERGITLAWNPSFYAFDSEQFNFPAVLRTTLLIPNTHAARGFRCFLEQWCEYAYGTQGANTVFFDTEAEAAEAAEAGLGIFLGPGDAMARLTDLNGNLESVRTFEFLLPEAYTFGIYCRADERSREVLDTAALIGKLAKKFFL
ncbi:LysR family transcriptional regulator [Luteolibacter sp. AS25]|uniref:LysR family transcriptional regulator n=1 Tax=Luteolibacter sp. AS25 TaxID=3135776 RepID=UPI00398AE9EA